jgi:hypothetical protein
MRTGSRPSGKRFAAAAMISEIDEAALLSAL